MSGNESTALARALPEPVTRRGIQEGQWLTLTNSLYPGAKAASVLLVWDYCKSRGLDPMKKPVHIVPMEVKSGNVYEWRDVVMPGIYEYRTTAHRTGEYLGHSEPVYGPDIEKWGLTFPEWCEITVYRWNGKAGQKVPFPVRTYFVEVVATTKDKQTQQWGPNSRWRRAPIQMLTKCTEAAGLREAFPEEIGNEPTAEEMAGQRSPDIDVTVPEAPLPAAVGVFQALPEALQDTIEKAFTVLGYSEAQRLQKLNEYLLAPNSVPEEAAETLLTSCREEFSRRTTETPKPKKDDNRKAKRTAPKEPVPEEVTPPPTSPAAEEVKPVSSPATDDSPADYPNPKDGEVLFE